MEYLSERTRGLMDEAGKLGLDPAQDDFIRRLIQIITDMAVIIDDAVDAVDELDMRLLEIEQQHDDK